MRRDDGISQASASTGSSTAWSRVVVRAVAPTSAVTASVAVVAKARSSAVKWDEVRLLSTDVPNGGFETAAGSAVADWTVRPASAEGVMHYADEHGGGASVEIAGNPDEPGSITSARIPVFPNVTHDFSAHVRPVRGASRMTVDWFDDLGRLVLSSPHDVTAPANTWSGSASPPPPLTRRPRRR